MHLLPGGARELLEELALPRSELARRFDDHSHQVVAAPVSLELGDTFAEEAPLMLAELRSAHAEGAAERFRRAAHSLKSNSNTFGAVRLGEMARALELGGLPPASEGGAALDAVAAEIDSALAALQAVARR